MKLKNTILFGLLTLLQGNLLFANAQHQSDKTIERVRVATKGVANPERGFRFELQIGLEKGEKHYLPNNWPFAYYQDDGVVMSLAYCYLSKYFDKDIPQSKLDALQADFDRA